MNHVNLTFLNALRSGINGTPLSKDPELDSDSWKRLLQLSTEQELLPLFFEAVYRCSSFKALDKSLREHYRQRAIQAVQRQIVQTKEFLTLLLHAQSSGLDPVVLKGIVIRQLYPQYMLRPSVDEDLLISPRDAETYHRFFLSEGLSIDDPEADIISSPELSYHRKNSPTYIELHMYPFPPDSDAYGDCNALFDGALNRTVTVQIEDVSVRTLAPTDHLMYLICHAYKHFLHSGVGIRQVCDICMFTRAYGAEIDWDRISQSCKIISVRQFVAAMFRIGKNYLGFEEVPIVFAGEDADESDLLEDILSDGLYGMEDVDRAHSSTLTLDAVASDRSGKRRGGVLRSVFLPAAKLQGHFPYLRRYPVLLPVAWSQRIWGYLSRRNGTAVHPGRSIEIGKRRIDLLKEYGIIE